MSKPAQCASCGGTLDPNAKFCKHCGAAVEPPEAAQPPAGRACPACEGDNDADAKFCKHCGATLGATSDAPAPKAPPADDAQPKRRAKRAVSDSDARPKRRAKPSRASGGSVGLIVVVLVGLGVFWLILRSSSSDDAPPPKANAPARIAVDAPGQGGPMPGAGGGAPQGGPAIEGEVRVADAMRAAAPRGGALFVIARSAAAKGGPPLAVVKLTPSPGSVPFRLGPENLMMGGAQANMNQPLRLEARWDADGNAGTFGPEDLVGALDTPARAGQSGVIITLDRRGEARPPLPPVTPGGGATPPSAPPAAPPSGSPADITGTITLSADLRARRPRGGVLFVIARLAGQETGPPLAAAKLTPGPEPMPFRIGQANVMMGGPFNKPVTLSVRWDADGNAMTKQPGDLIGAPASEAPITPGTSGVSIILDKAL